MKDIYINENDNFFIPYNVPSSKNSRQIVWKDMGGGKRRPLIIDSKTTRNYKKNTKKIYQLLAKQFRSIVDSLPKPVTIEFTFIRGSKRKFDYINPAQTVQDIMVEHEWIEDDDCNNIIPAFQPYQYDKEQPGVIIKIIK